MPCRSAIAAAVLCMTLTSAQAWDHTRYPDLSGQWRRLGPSNPIRFDPSKPPGRGQQAPLTPEYEAVFEASLAAQAQGGQGNSPHSLAARRACRES
jgi:hypothetical protein